MRKIESGETILDMHIYMNKHRGTHISCTQSTNNLNRTITATIGKKWVSDLKKQGSKNRNIPHKNAKGILHFSVHFHDGQYCWSVKSRLLPLLYHCDLFPSLLLFMLLFFDSTRTRLHQNALY